MRLDESCSARRASPAPTRPATTDPTRPLSVTPQREWALEKVQAGGPGWTFLALPSMISDLEPAVHDTDALFALHKLKMVEPDSDEEFHDLWDTFGWEQDQLVEAVTRAPRTVVLSGDVHFSAEHVRSEPEGEFIEWTVTSVTSPNLDDKMGWPRGAESKNYEAALLKMLPAMQWCDLDSHGFAVVEASTQLVSCQWWFVESACSSRATVSRWAARSRCRCTDRARSKPRSDEGSRTPGPRAAFADSAGLS